MAPFILFLKKTFKFSDVLQNTFEASDRLVMEMDLDFIGMGMGSEDMDFSQIMSMMSEIMLKPPNSLKSLLSEADYTYLQGFMRDSMPMPIPFYSMIKPVFLAEQISISYCMRGQPESYELFFSSQAKELGKPVSGLETFEDQLSFIQDIPLEDQAQKPDGNRSKGFLLMSGI